MASRHPAYVVHGPSGWIVLDFQVHRQAQRATTALDRGAGQLFSPGDRISPGQQQHRCRPYVAYCHWDSLPCSGGRCRALAALTLDGMRVEYTTVEKDLAARQYLLRTYRRVQKERPGVFVSDPDDLFRLRVGIEDVLSLDELPTH
eukprot:scaffold7_cov414-Pavlova_lutheri.AAC.15